MKQTLQPVNSLKARIVTIKGYTEPIPFLEAAQKQLQQLEIQANIGISVNDKGEPKRLTLKINKPERSFTVVGFSVAVSDLSADDSIKLQTYGLGGKRRLGCGIFSPNIRISLNRKGEPYDTTVIS